MSSGAYRVDISGRVLGEMRVLSLRAIRKGLSLQLASAFAAMNARLAVDPDVWGDPQSQLPALGLLLYRRVEGPIIVYYAVDQTRQIVYVRNVLPFPGRGLESVP
jgi:hypothetical protein